MKNLNNVHTIMIVSLLTIAFLSYPPQARADWPNAGMRPVGVPSVVPNPAKSLQGRNVLPARIEAEPHREAPKPIAPETRPMVRPSPERYKEPSKHHDPVNPGYFRRDTYYYGYVPTPFPYADVDQTFAIPDGFELVSFNGETFYYHDGIFYQQVGGQLVAIPAVIGAVVDSIPQDYQIVMADGVHYLLTQGVYYQRVDEGFEVVPGPDEE